MTEETIWSGIKNLGICNNYLKILEEMSHKRGMLTSFLPMGMERQITTETNKKANNFLFTKLFKVGWVNSEGCVFSVIGRPFTLMGR